MILRWRRHDDDFRPRVREHLIVISEDRNFPAFRSAVSPALIEIARANYRRRWNSGQGREVKGPAGIAEAEQSYANETLSEFRFCMRSKLTRRGTLAGSTFDTSSQFCECLSCELLESTDRDAGRRLPREIPGTCETSPDQVISQRLVAENPAEALAELDW